MANSIGLLQWWILQSAAIKSWVEALYTHQWHLDALKEQARGQVRGRSGQRGVQTSSGRGTEIGGIVFSEAQKYIGIMMKIY